MPGALDFTSFRRRAFKRFQSHVSPKPHTSHLAPHQQQQQQQQQLRPSETNVPAIVVTPAAPEPPPATAPYQQLQSLLFRLPGELRNVIYATYLPGALGAAHHVRADAFALRTTALAKRRRPLPPLMLACRRLYNELSFPAASHAAVRVSWGGGGTPVQDPLSGPTTATTTTAAVVVTEVAFYGAVAWARLRTLHLVVDMHRARFTCWFFFAAQVLRGCPGLRELVVDWRPVEDVWGDVGDAAADRGQLQALVARRFLFAITQVESLRVVIFRGDVPDSWLAFVKREGGGGGGGLRVVKEAAAAAEE